MGPEEGIRLLEGMAGAEGMVINRNGSEFITSGFRIG
jgi:hypothetical protein